jgi:hypothetical protein
MPWLIPNALDALGLLVAAVILINPGWFLRASAWLAMRAGGVTRDTLYDQTLPFVRPFFRVTVDRQALGDLTRQDRLRAVALLTFARLLGAFGVAISALALVNGLQA